MISPRTVRLADSLTAGRWLARVVVALTALTFLTRLPGLILTRMFNVDESYLATMGLTIGRGGQLYRDAVDRKPPVLPWLYSLSQTLTGSEDLRPLRLLASLTIAATGVVVAVLVLRLAHDRTAAFAAGALVVLGTVAFLPADGQAANFELFALLPASTAVLLAVTARAAPPSTRRLLLFLGAGALVGVAGMTKQPFFAMLAPVAWEAWRARPRRTAFGATGAGVLASVVTIGLPFGLGAVWRWAWVDTGDYLGGQVDVVRVLGMLALVVGVFAALHLPTLSSIWSNRSRLRQVDAVIWFWFAGAFIAVVPGFRFIAHYFELMVPPMAVLAGVLLAAALADDRRVAEQRSLPDETSGPTTEQTTPVAIGQRPTVRTVARHPVGKLLAGSALIAVACTLMATMGFANADQVRPELVTEIQSHTRPNDRILVWGALPETYWRSRRLPGARFLSVGYVTGKWADRPNPPHNAESIEPYRSRWKIFNRDLRAHPPVVVIDTSTSGMDGWDQYGPGGYHFGAILTGCYTNDGTVDGMTIWTLVDRACVERLAVSS
jgi:hypothetical protein